jgi:2'-5' RNA ligase
VTRRRLFVAVDLDEASRKACADAAARLRSAGCVARWIAPENYHFTVAFLGGVAAERVDDVRGMLASSAADLRAFELNLGVVGAFPNERRARVIFVGPRRAVPAFASMCAAVRMELATLGFAFDDGHDDAHVTLARAKDVPLPMVAPPVTRPLCVNSLALYESFTEPRGARYVRLEELGFGAGRGGGFTQASETQ